MGLAASQARFLGITARKNSCELRSMQIAQEKLSITNKLSQASQDYQRSLDATKLVWDSEYITDGSIYDVSYDLLMSPSLLNNYSPQLLTNFRNQVVLDAQYAEAIKSITQPVGKKIVNNGGVLTREVANFIDLKTGGADRTKENFILFLEALNQNGILNKKNLISMTAALNGVNGDKFYDPKNGLGGYIKSKFTSNSMNLATLKEYINEITNPNSDYINDLREIYGSSYDTNGNKLTTTLEDGTVVMEPDTNYDKAIKLGELLDFNGIIKTVTDPTTGENYTQIQGNNYVSKEKDAGGNNINKTGSFEDTIIDAKDSKLELSDADFNFTDLMNKEITLSGKDAAAIGNNVALFIEHLYSIMGNFFAVNENSVDKEYLDYAMVQICNLNGLKWDSTVGQVVKDASGNAEFNTDNVLSTGDPANKHTGMIKTGDTYKLSLSNTAKGLLTYFEKAIEGFDSGYSVDSVDKKLVENSYYITNDPEYYYFINNPESIDMDDETQLLLDYYAQMFNQICANGWTENDRVSDKEDLKNMLKNGTIFTSTLSDDGNFYQGPYTSNNFIAEVSDEDAIARAEAEFKTQQLKLSAKEEELNIDLQMVDAELSALTTEYDTVKQMISKAVEKGFSTLGG